LAKLTLGANCLCTSAAFTAGVEPVSFAVMCQLDSTPSALCAVSVRRLAHLLTGFLQTGLRGPALAFGQWLTWLSMSPIRFSHRGLSPHKFAPMLGAHPSLKRGANGAPPVRKVRWAREGTGKSVGVRIVYLTRNELGEVYLLTLYAKSESSSISAATLKEIRRALEA
jgi:hypothetical protein